MEFDGFAFFLIAICIGYFSLRLRLVPASATDALPPILLHICFPAMLFQSFAATTADTLLSAGIPTVIASILFSLLPFFATNFLLQNMDGSRRSVLRFISGVGNTSFVCAPLMSLFLTKSELSIVFVHCAVMDFLIWGVHHQIFVGSKGGSRREALKNIFCSPNLIALLAGVVCSVAAVRLPGFISYSVTALAAAVTPLSLIFIGMLICRYGLFGWIKNRTAILYTLWKVLLLPCIVFAILYFLVPLKTALILAILFGSPAPVSGVVWCKQYGHDTELAVQCLIPSTILYFIVMGASLLLLTHFGLLG